MFEVRLKFQLSYNGEKVEIAIYFFITANILTKNTEVFLELFSNKKKKHMHLVQVICWIVCHSNRKAMCALRPWA